jgi:hypothetical protein
MQSLRSHCRVSNEWARPARKWQGETEREAVRQAAKESVAFAGQATAQPVAHEAAQVRDAGISACTARAD